MGYVSPPLQPADENDPYAICPGCGATYSEDAMDHMDQLFEERGMGTECWDCGCNAAEFEGKINDELEPCWSCDKWVVNEANAVGQVDEGDYAPYICPECGKKPENAEHLWDRGE